MIKLNIVKKILFIIIFLTCVCSCKEQKPPQVTFDVPALIGKNIDEVRKVLGKPLENPPDPSNSKEEHYDNIYKKDGQTLLISYNLNNRKISSFFIVSSTDYDNVKDLMKIGNLDSLQTMNYSAEAEHPYFTDSFNSIKITLR